MAFAMYSFPSGEVLRSYKLQGVSSKLRLKSDEVSAVIILGGEVPEWTNGAVSKTVVVLWATEGSNPSLSASSQVRQ